MAPRRALNPIEGDVVVEAAASPSRALPSQETPTSSFRVSFAALAAGAFATAGVGVTVAASQAAAETTPTATATATTDVAAARNARVTTGALAAFSTSRSDDREDLTDDTSGTAQEAATARATALAQTAQSVQTASVSAASTSRQQAVSSAAQAISKEEQRRKADGWTPGGSNPSFMRPVKGGTFSSPFGWRTNPVTGASEGHTGQDISIGCGTPIYAPQDGTVTFVGPYGSGGNALRIEHGKYNGKDIQSGYYHAQSYVVTVGQKVTRGQLVGYVGTTGTSTGCHLHYMIFEDGENVNPVPYIGSSS